MLTAGLVIAFLCCIGWAERCGETGEGPAFGLLGAVACVIAIIRINGSGT